MIKQTDIISLIMDFTIPDYKFGIFIHWGIYSIPAFNPVRNSGKNIYNGSEWYLGRMKNIFMYGKKH